MGNFFPRVTKQRRRAEFLTIRSRKYKHERVAPPRNIQFHFGLFRGGETFPFPYLSVPSLIAYSSGILPFSSSSFRGENPHLSEQRRTSLRSLRVGRLFISSSHAPPSPPILRFLRSVSASPATRLFVIFRSACFPPKLGPSTRKTVHRLVVQINRGGEITFFSSR